MANLRLLSLFVTFLCCTVSAQTFRRLGACPKLGQFFDIRTEVHAPVNGSEAIPNANPDTTFTLKIAKSGSKAQEVTKFFNIKQSPLEKWHFTYYEDRFAQDAGKPVLVNVAAKAYRRVALHEPGYYTATLTYYNGEQTVAHWYVRNLPKERRAKNVLLFIGDGMTTNMITAARLIGHKSINGRYTSRMMSHSLDSFITDSANSATALYSGHKSTVNALGVYRDSSPDPFDDPKVESIAEIFQRQGGHIGIVSTAYIADATPSALNTHTADRSKYPAIVDQMLNGNTNYSWPAWSGPDVLFGGGAEQFYKGGETYEDKDYYRLFEKKGYHVVTNKTSLLSGPNKKTLGIFCQSNLPVWLDRNVYTDNLRDFENDPMGSSKPALDLPGLKEMTLKAVDILENTSGDDGWFLMSEAASIDKQMHTLDYDRALGDLLELDDTVTATMNKLKQLGIDEETLVITTADHGHGFDVMGSVDTLYLDSKKTARTKRNAIGTYAESGLSQYVVVPENGTAVPEIFYTEGSHFPANWNPRYTLFQGVSADPDRRENYQVHEDGPREPAVELASDSDDYYVNPEDAQDGFVVNGTLPVNNAQGVHSLTDVPVFAAGPCQELFLGTLNNIDIFFNMAECLGLSKSKNSKPIVRRSSTGFQWDDEQDWWGSESHAGF